MEERLRLLEEENRVAIQMRLESEKTIELLQEKVRIAVEEAQVHARKNLQAEDEIRKVRASALKVGIGSGNKSVKGEGGMGRRMF